MDVRTLTITPAHFDKSRSTSSGQVKQMSVTSLENRVMDLCSRAVSAEDDEEVRRLVAELRQILHERIELLRSSLVFTSIASALASQRSPEQQLASGPVSVDSEAA